jgi:hypothetical protein
MTPSQLLPTPKNSGENKYDSIPTPPNNKKTQVRISMTLSQLLPIPKTQVRINMTLSQLLPTPKKLR